MLKIKLFFRNIGDWIREHINKDKVNKALPFVLLAYLFLTAIPYHLIPIYKFYSLFYSSRPLGITLRLFTIAGLCLYALLVMVVNKIKFPWRWFIVIVSFLLLVLFCMMITPNSYEYGYISSQYSILHYTIIEVGVKKLATMYLTSVADFALAFTFLFLLPSSVTGRKQFLIFTFVVAVWMLFEVGYSVIKDRSDLVQLITGAYDPYGGYELNIGGKFGNKQDFGAFLSVGCASSIVGFCLLIKEKKKYALLKVFYIVSSLVFAGYSVLTLCKTSILSNVFIWFMFILYLIYLAFRKKLYIGFIIVGLVSVLIAVFILFINIPSWHEGKIGGAIYKVVYQYILSRVIFAVVDRDNLWLTFVNNFNGSNFFYGFTKGGLPYFTQSIIKEGQTGLHNGLAVILGSYGIVGFTLFAILIIYGLKHILFLFKVNDSLIFALIGTLGASLIFCLSEAEAPLISSACPVFTYNVLLFVLPKGLETNKKFCKKEKLTYAH